MEGKLSHFYGSIQGSASSEATRRATKNSGISAHVRSWDVGVQVTGVHEDGTDVFYISATHGSTGHGPNDNVARVSLKDGRLLIQHTTR